MEMGEAKAVQCLYQFHSFQTAAPHVYPFHFKLPMPFACAFDLVR